MILHKVFMIFILFGITANALSVDEILTQDIVQPSFDCNKVIDNGKNDELYICNYIGVRNEFENKRLALTDSVYGSYYRLVATHIDSQDKKKLKNISQNMIKNRKKCLKLMDEIWQNLPDGANPVIPLFQGTDCMQESYLKALQQITELLYATPKYKPVFEKIFYTNPKKYYELIQGDNITDTTYKITSIIDKMAQDNLIDKTGKLIIKVDSK